MASLLEGQNERRLSICVDIVCDQIDSCLQLTCTYYYAELICIIIEDPTLEYFTVH